MAIARKQALPKKKQKKTSIHHICSFKGNERKSKTSTIASASDLVPLKNKQPLSYDFL